MLTDMSQPLGQAVGNANEIVESIDVLRGGGPDDVRELTVVFATEMLMLAGFEDREGARHAVDHAISSGDALETMKAMTALQGGDARFIEDPTLFEPAPHEHLVTAPDAGVVHRCDALAIGLAAVRLGAGRATKEDAIDPSVGIMVDAKVGDAVDTGDVLARVAYRTKERLERALAVLEEAWQVGPEPMDAPTLIKGVIT